MQDRFFNAWRFQAFLGDDVGDDFGVIGGVKNRTAKFKLLAKFLRIDQVAIVRQCQCALVVIDKHRLCIATAFGACRGITAMSDRHFSLWHPLQNGTGEHFVDQTNILMRSDHAVGIDGDPTAFLSAVLQCIQSVIGCWHNLHIFFGAIDAKDTAFFMELIPNGHHHSPIRRFMIS